MPAAAHQRDDRRCRWSEVEHERIDPTSAGDSEFAAGARDRHVVQSGTAERLLRVRSVACCAVFGSRRRRVRSGSSATICAGLASCRSRCRSSVAATRQPANPWARWTVTEHLSAHHVLIVHVETRHLDEARAIAQQLDRAARRTSYAEILIYFHRPGRPDPLAAAPRAVDAYGRLRRDGVRLADGLA